VGTALDELLHQFFSFTLPTWLGLPVPHLGYRNIMPVNDQGYVTLNALSSTATILAGVMAGELLRNAWSKSVKLLILILAGAAGVALAQYVLLDSVPMVPKIWTCTFTVFATGCTCLVLAAFYLVIDVLNLRGWALPLVVLGMNSLALYVMAELLRGPIEGGLSPFITFPQGQLPEAWQPVVPAVLTLVVLWCIGCWLYRRRIFFKV
jgi:predicted acyltransferase